MKLTDYIADFLSQQGIRHVFGLTGGAAVHMFDSLARHPDIRPIFTHHEQAAALAAEACARATESIGALVVTTGPGGTNALTGICAAWLDSIPVICISGQARLEHTTANKPVRQLGTQQLDIIPIVKPVTKYAIMIEDPASIRYHLEKAVYLATKGRPGPVWIDLPLNFQWVQIEPDALPSFDPTSEHLNHAVPVPSSQSIDQCLAWLASSERPLLLAGSGIRLGHAVDDFRKLVKQLRVPVVSSWGAADIIPTDDPSYLGRVGIAGNRGANLAMQNCDLLLAIGSHLSLQLTGPDYSTFARQAKRVVVNIDADQLRTPTVRIDLALHCDAGHFVRAMLEGTPGIMLRRSTLWADMCSQYQRHNRVPSDWRHRGGWVDPYVFLDSLSQALTEEDVVVVDGGGTVVYTSMQGVRLKPNQRLIISSGICAMGTGLPESVGACLGSGRRRTVCLCGDGSMQLNIQELQTITHHKLPVKVVVFNNGGYLAIRQTQDQFLAAQHVGSASDGGMSLPDFPNVAQAYGIPAFRIHDNSEIATGVERLLREPGPMICEIVISPQQEVIPQMGFRENADGSHSARPLEDMSPLLPRQEFRRLMLVSPLGES
jgi:acetolactate synthase-1/2/3 large subunit